MLPLIELVVATGLLGAGGVAAITVVYRKVQASSWALRRRQRRNAMKLVQNVKFKCTEHRRIFDKSEVVLYASRQYCPDCFQEYILQASDSITTDLGDVRRELGLVPNKNKDTK